MSYILDALRRAESERQRGQVPGLGAAPLPLSHAAAPADSRAGLWVALGVALLAAAAVLWWVLRSTERPLGAVATALPTAPQPGAGLSKVAPPALQPAPAAVPVAGPVAALGLPPAARPTSLPRVVSAPTAVPTAAPPALVAAPVPAPAGPAVDPRPLKLAELSPQQRSEWPALSVGGSIWSDSAASRFVILNGQVMREGQSVSPGLVLERIQPRSALLRWRGLLVELPL